MTKDEAMQLIDFISKMTESEVEEDVKIENKIDKIEDCLKRCLSSGNGCKGCPYEDVCDAGKLMNTIFKDMLEAIKYIKSEKMNMVDKLEKEKSEYAYHDGPYEDGYARGAWDAFDRAIAIVGGIKWGL